MFVFISQICLAVCPSVHRIGDVSTLRSTGMFARPFNGRRGAAGRTAGAGVGNPVLAPVLGQRTRCGGCSGLDVVSTAARYLHYSADDAGSAAF